MKNSNYYVTPIQAHGRSAYDYGHTVLHRDPEPSRWGWWIVGAVVGLLVVGLVL